MVPEVAPPYAQLLVVLVEQDLEHLGGFQVSQNSFSFVRSSMDVFYTPNQSHFGSPIVF